MPKVKRYLNRTNGWDQTASAVEANAADLPHMEAHRIQLAAFSQEAKSLTVQQAAFAANKQEITRRLQKVMKDGDALVDFLLTGVRQHYGKESEKMTEFGQQPFRGFSRTVKPDPEPQTSSSSTPTPDAVK